MSPTSLRRWIWVHKWSSLVCTVFMLLLCLTGLPLIFSHEIQHWLHAEMEPRDMPAGTPRASMDEVLKVAQTRHPDLVPQFIGAEADDDRLWFVTLGPTALAEVGRHTLMVDARSAALLGEPNFEEGFMHWMLRLHVDLFADLPGTLFLGFMGLLLLAAIISGVVLYAPFMRKLSFGTVRHERNARVRWLDMHNLLGVVTLVWVMVVGATGVINTLGEPLFKLWQATEVQQMLAPYAGLPAPERPGSLQQAAAAAEALEPSMKLSFVAFPGTSFSSPHHFSVFMRGTEPLTARLFKPVLVDAQTAKVTDSRELPWYLKALLVSQPLHFGDYGGLPLKILWALLTLATIVVLGSGLYLWWARRRVTLDQQVAVLSGTAGGAA